MRRPSGRRMNLKPSLRRRSEIQYRKSLLAIANQIGQIVDGTYDGSQASADSISKTLVDYSEVISDWAEQVGRRMFAQVEQEEWNQWKSVSEEIGAGLRDVVGNTPVGQVAQDIVYRQIQLMKSLPLEAADRVMDIQKRAMQAVITGERPDELYEMIMASGDVTASRAQLIARTEIGRATGALTQARALSVGSEGWDNPPTLDGMTGHAGCLPNCKCWPEVQIPAPRK